MIDMIYCSEDEKMHGVKVQVDAEEMLNWRVCVVHEWKDTPDGVDVVPTYAIGADHPTENILCLFDDSQYEESWSARYTTQGEADAALEECKNFYQIDESVRIKCEVCGKHFHVGYGWARIALATNSDWKPNVECEACSRDRNKRENEYWDAENIRRAQTQIKKLRKAVKLIEAVVEDGNVYGGMHSHEDWYGNMKSASRQAEEEADRMENILNAGKL